jgi:hypothetical protein
MRALNPPNAPQQGLHALTTPPIDYRQRPLSSVRSVRRSVFAAGDFLPATAYEYWYTSGKTGGTTESALPEADRSPGREGARGCQPRRLIRARGTSQGDGLRLLLFPTDLRKNTSFGSCCRRRGTPGCVARQAHARWPRERRRRGNRMADLRGARSSAPGLFLCCFLGQD